MKRPDLTRPSVESAAVSETFLRSSGPGGQNVNKVETAVQLRFALDRSCLSPAVVKRLSLLAGQRLTQGGEIVITARQHRTGERNRVAAMEILMDLIRRASVAPVRRIATRPTHGSHKRRLEAKSQRSALKRGRLGSIDE